MRIRLAAGALTLVATAGIVLVAGSAAGGAEERATAARGGIPTPEMPQLDGRLFFEAATPGTGVELWRTNGRRQGTKLVKDINPGTAENPPDPDRSFPRGFMRLGNRVLFGATDGVRGAELWRTNGTTAGTRLVKDIDPGDDDGFPGPDSSNPTSLVRFGKVVLFRARTDDDGTELWRTDGTRRGTRLVKDILPGSEGSSPAGFARLGNRVYFGADRPGTGRELWRTDGTRKATKLVKDIIPGPECSCVDGLTRLGKRLIFAAERPDVLDDNELWRTDGTAKGTKLVKNIAPGSDGSYPRDFVALGKQMIFTADDFSIGRELWKTKGTRRSTKRVANIDGSPLDSDPQDLVALGKRVLFSAEPNEADNRELYRTDGTAAGTKRVRDIYPGAEGSYPCDMTRLGRVVLFGARDAAFGVGAGFELWRSDGTRRGTRLVKDIVPGAGHSNAFGCD